MHPVAPMGGLVEYGPEMDWTTPLMALIIFDLGLALELLRLATLLVVVVIHLA